MEYDNYAIKGILIKICLFGMPMKGNHVLAKGVFFVTLEQLK